MRGYDLFKVLRAALGAGYAALRCVESQHWKSTDQTIPDQATHIILCITGHNMA